MADNLQLPQTFITYNETDLKKFLTRLLTEIDKLKTINTQLEARVKKLEDAA